MTPRTETTPAPRHAFTLVEAVVAMAVFALLMYAVYDMFVLGMRAFTTGEGKSESLEGAVLAHELIVNDIRRQFYWGVAPNAVAATPPVAINLGCGGGWGRELNLTCFEDLVYPPTPVPTVKTTKVTYSLADSGDPAYKYLRRTETPGDTRVYKTIKLTDLQFKLVHHPRALDGTGADRLAWVALKIVGYGIPTPTKTKADNENTLLTLVALDSFSLRRTYPYAVEESRRLRGYPY